VTGRDVIEWLDYKRERLAFYERMAARADITEEGRRDGREQSAKIRAELEAFARLVITDPAPLLPEGAGGRV
jgi:hypothetical protein